MTKNNIFIISTEYHFILAMSIIDSYFYDTEKYSNKIILKGIRSAAINIEELKSKFQVITIKFEDVNFKNLVKENIYNTKVDNLFVVHTYRAYETYILSLAAKSTKIHLMQDGSLFYHTMEVSLFLNRIRETYQIYKQLLDKKILLKTLVFYPRHMHKSRFVDELWMTNPDLFVDKNTRLKINKIDLFPNENSVEKFNNYFNVNPKEDYRGINDCMIYLAPIIKDKNKLPIEIEQIKLLKQKVFKSNLIIKLHPGMRDKTQYNTLYEVFGSSVIQNFIPAEMYMANSKNSCVIGTASTALFYNNPDCQNFALKKVYQQLGIYASWKNVALPDYVIQIDNMEDFDLINK